MMKTAGVAHLHGHKLDALEDLIEAAKWQAGAYRLLVQA